MQPITQLHGVSRLCRFELWKDLAPARGGDTNVIRKDVVKKLIFALQKYYSRWVVADTCSCRSYSNQTSKTHVNADHKFSDSSDTSRKSQTLSTNNFFMNCLVRLKHCWSNYALHNLELLPYAINAGAFVVFECITMFEGDHWVISCHAYEWSLQQLQADSYFYT